LWILWTYPCWRWVGRSCSRQLEQFI